MLAELDNPIYVEKLRAALKVHVAERRLELYKPYAKQRDFHAAGATFRERLLMAGNQLGKCISGRSLAHPMPERKPYKTCHCRLQRCCQDVATDIAHGEGGKPKGLHWATYQRLKAEHYRLVHVSFRDMGRKLGFLHKLLEP